MIKRAHNNFVFINCPFDDDYAPLLRAVVYAIYGCGFFPVAAMTEDNGLDNRLDKILRIISKCKYGVHDISRIEINTNHLPRFNMPFELGIFFAAKRYGNRKQKEKKRLCWKKRNISTSTTFPTLMVLIPKRTMMIPTPLSDVSVTG